MEGTFHILVYIAVSVFLFQFVQGADKTPEFNCVVCSAAVVQGTGLLDNEKCLNETSKIFHKYLCNRTCTHAEQIDKRSGRVNSVSRTCGPDLGTRCVADYTNYNCVRSCHGELCNNFTSLYDFFQLGQKNKNGLNEGSKLDITRKVLSICLLLSLNVFWIL